MEPVCVFCDHELNEHECIGADSEGNEVWLCSIKNCRCEQLEVAAP